MCLVVKSHNTICLPADVIVYKVVICEDDGLMFTPFQKAEVKMGETYHSNLLSWSINNQIVYKIGLHSFAGFIDAIKFILVKTTLLGNEHPLINKLRIVKCVIPAGSVLKEGIFNNGFNSIVSNQITYVEFVDYKI